MIFCSCDVRRENGLLIGSNCRHTRAVKMNEERISDLRDMLKKGYSEKEKEGKANRWFVSWICVREHKLSVDNEEEDIVICIQMDQVSGVEMTTREKDIGRRWSCCIGYAVYDSNLLCCIQSALGSGIRVTKFRCVNAN